MAACGCGYVTRGKRRGRKVSSCLSHRRDGGINTRKRRKSAKKS